MGKENAQTLQAYADNIERSIAHSTSFQSAPPILRWLETSLSGLGFDAKILEIGSGVGRDALYVQSLGYRVQCSDALPHFVNYMRSKGLDAIPLNILTDNIAHNYDLIFSNAVLLHCTPRDMEEVLYKIFHALNDKGRFSFTLKAGEGEEWSNKRLKEAMRYFCFWQEAPIRHLLTQVGFTKISIEESLTPVHPDPWLHIRASK